MTKTKWAVSCAVTGTSNLSEWLDNGWEPFAVVCRPIDSVTGGLMWQEVMWFRKKIGGAK